MKKKVVLFPGTDALENAEFRKSVWCISEVQQKIIETEDLIKKVAGVDWDLKEVMKEGNKPETLWFKKLIFCSLATQVVIFKQLEQEHKNIDYLMGFSLGDVARNVCAEVCTYQEAVLGLLFFVTNIDQSKAGTSYLIKIPESLNEYREKLEFEKYGIYISVHQNDRFFLIAGENESFVKWKEEVASQLSIQLIYMYPFALHCPVMNNVYEAFLPYLDGVSSKEPIYGLYSSIQVDEIVDDKSLKQEIADNMIKPVLFKTAISSLLENNEHIEFVNVGPAQTLLKFIKLMQLENDNYSLTDYFTQFLLTKELNV